MDKSFKKILLIGTVTFLIFYLVVSCVNLGLRLTSTKQPTCNPFYCKEIIKEDTYCLISTPGTEDCLKVAGVYFVPSAPFAYITLFISFGLALLISKKFYLTRWLILFGLMAIVIYSFRVFLGAASFSLFGIIFELQKLGLY